MPSRDPVPKQPERDAFRSPTMVEYNDGALNILFEEPGDEIVWGAHKYADPAASPLDRVIVRTSSGNRYVLGSGLAINVREKTVRDLFESQENLPDITIGEPWSIPGFVDTTRIENVELRYKIGPGMGDRKIDRNDPFKTADLFIDAAEQHLVNLGKR